MKKAQDFIGRVINVRVKYKQRSGKISSRLEPFPLDAETARRVAESVNFINEKCGEPKRVRS